MARHILTITFLFLSVAMHAQNSTDPVTGGPEKLSPGAVLLFANVKCNLTIAEKNVLFRTLQLKLSSDSKSFVIDEYPVTVSVFPTDMNADGKEEIFVSLGSTALFGDAGEDFYLFIKDNAGVYQRQTEIAGGRPVILSLKNMGYPDILIGGPGFEFPVFRWNGRQYVSNRKMKDAALNNNNSTDIEAYSKLYTK